MERPLYKKYVPSSQSALKNKTKNK